MRINSMIAVAIMTYKEGVRQRIIYGIVLLAVGVIFFAVLLAGLFMRDIAKVILDFCLSAVNIGGLLVPLFLAVHLLARDFERRTVFTILSRPVSRPQYLLGKFYGLAMLAATIMGILTLATVAAITISKLLYPEPFFASLSWPAVFTAIGVSYLGTTVLIAVVVLWSTVTTSSFLATLLTLATYCIGQTVADMVRFISSKVPGVAITPLVEKTVSAAMYLFPNLAAFDLKLAAAHGLAIPVSDVLFLAAYAVGYTTAVLSLAIFLFQRRDLT